MGRPDFYIDKLTHSIEDTGTGKCYDTEVVAVVSADLKTILKKHGWRFNWKSEFKQEERQLFKLLIKGDEIIQGLISLQLEKEYIEMQLIETAPHNYGRSKRYQGVPGNLVAFACKTSFEFGFGGFVGFRAKTRLIRHYIDTLWADLVFRDRMSISGSAARKLVNLYFKNYFNDR